MEEDTAVQWNHCRSTRLPSISKQSRHLLSVHLNIRYNIAGVIVRAAAEMRPRRCWKSLIFTLYTRALVWPHARKSKGVRSWERSARNRGEPRTTQRPGNVSLKYLRTMCGRAPSCWTTTKSRMLSANNWSCRDCSSMSRYDVDVIVASAKK